jgi:uncharacterized protein YndB with AHSA1/START domain
VDNGSLDAECDLILDRHVALRPEEVWAGWTEPEHLVHWFTPAPWTVPSADVDLRPGGRFNTVMRSPEGEDVENFGCYLEVEAPRRLVWTGAMREGFRPNEFSQLDFPFTVVITLSPDGEGTNFHAQVMHATTGDRQQHEEMGFADGWSAALDQLVDHMTQRRPTA